MAVLQAHPLHLPKARFSVEASLHCDSAGARLVFQVRGDVVAIKLDRGGGGSRRDGLWHTTCFEAFVRPDDSEVYFELNLAPSGDWASYGFDGYRAGMENASIAPQEEVSFLEESGIFEIAAHFSWEQVPLLSDATKWKVGLSAVIEEEEGTKTYWALAHPNHGPPDFHHPDCFVLEVTPAV